MISNEEWDSYSRDYALVVEKLQNDDTQRKKWNILTTYIVEIEAGEDDIILGAISMAELALIITDRKYISKEWG